MVIILSIIVLVVSLILQKIINSLSERWRGSIEYYFSLISTYLFLCLTVYSLAIIVVDFNEKGKIDFTDIVNFATIAALYIVLNQEFQSSKFNKKERKKLKENQSEFIETEYNPFIRFEKGKIKD